MAKTKGSRSGSELERLVEAWLETLGWTAHRAAATGFVKLKSGRGFVRSHDLFGCLDFLAFKEGELPHETWAIQCTSPANRGPRRAKIEKHRWPISWRVSIITHGSKREGKATVHWFNVEDYQVDKGWGEPRQIGVDVKALETHRREKAASKKKKQESSSA